MNDKHPDLIFAYTRAEAIADGVLIDVTPTAKEAGFRYPVALTCAVWHECVAVPTQASWQDESGRLWDILYMLSIASRTAGHSDRLRFTVLVQNDAQPAKPVTLQAVCGPGDDAEPVITVMFMDED